MPLIDIILLIIFIAAAVTGFRKGFIAQVGSLAAIVVAVIACRALGPTATGWVMPDGPDAETGSSMSRIIASALAYSGVYLVAYYAVILVVRLLKMVTHTLFLGPLDRIGGAAVNIIKWGLAVSLVLNLYLALWPDGKMLRSSTIAGENPSNGWWRSPRRPSVFSITRQHLNQHQRQLQRKAPQPQKYERRRQRHTAGRNVRRL